MKTAPDQTYYRHLFGRLIYTDGVRQLAQRAGAFWLIDAIASYQSEPRIWRAMYQVWRLEVNENRTAKLIGMDGDYNQLVEQFFRITDYADDVRELMVVHYHGQS